MATVIFFAPQNDEPVRMPWKTKTRRKAEIQNSDNNKFLPCTLRLSRQPEGTQNNYQKIIQLVLICPWEMNFQYL